MKTLNFNKDKDVILFFGIFLILIIEFLLNISLFLSKILAVYVFNNLYTITYSFFSFVLIILFFEIRFLKKVGNYFTITNFKKITILILALFLLSLFIPYLEATYVSLYMAERFDEPDRTFYYTSFIYQSNAYAIHNLLIIIFSFIRIKDINKRGDE